MSFNSTSILSLVNLAKRRCGLRIGFHAKEPCTTHSIGYERVIGRIFCHHFPQFLLVKEKSSTGRKITILLIWLTSLVLATDGLCAIRSLCFANCLLPVFFCNSISRTLSSEDNLDGITYDCCVLELFVHYLRCAYLSVGLDYR